VSKALIDIRPSGPRKARETEKLEDWIKRQETHQDDFEAHIDELVKQLDLPGMLTSLRRDRQLSQAALAQATCMSQSQIAKIESGANANPSISTAMKVLAPFGLRLGIVKAEA
jgi:DNA-binding XRE family transcriptional regulator